MSDDTTASKPETSYPFPLPLYPTRPVRHSCFSAISCCSLPFGSLLFSSPVLHADRHPGPPTPSRPHRIVSLGKGSSSWTSSRVSIEIGSVRVLAAFPNTCTLPACESVGSRWRGESLEPFDETASTLGESLAQCLRFRCCDGRRDPRASTRRPRSRALTPPRTRAAARRQPKARPNSGSTWKRNRGCRQESSSTACEVDLRGSHWRRPRHPHPHPLELRPLSGQGGGERHHSRPHSARQHR